MVESRLHERSGDSHGAQSRLAVLERVRDALDGGAERSLPDGVDLRHDGLLRKQGGWLVLGMSLPLDSL
ncbi:hypothetical protein D3C86_1913030 [compost metagenome]